MMRGPKPTPSSILKGRGTFRPDRRRDELVLPVGSPPCPHSLVADARREYRRLAKLLGGLGVLTLGEPAALSLLAVSWARWEKAEAEIAKSGEVVTAPSGYPIPSPWLAISNRAHNQVLKLCEQFGLTPSARSRVTVKPSEAAAPDDKQRFFVRRA